MVGSSVAVSSQRSNAVEMKPDSRSNRCPLNCSPWCCRVTIACGHAEHEKAFTLPSVERKTSEGCGRAGTELLKCTGLPEGPGSATEPCEAQTVNRRENSHLQRNRWLACPVSSVLGSAFPLAWPPATYAGLRGSSCFHLCRIAPRKFRRLVGPGPPVGLPLALIPSRGSRLSRRSITRFFSTLWKKKSQAIRFLVIPRSNVLADAPKTFSTEPGDI